VKKVQTQLFPILQPQLNLRVRSLATRIANEYREMSEIPVFIGILKGSFIFLADLVRSMPFDVIVDFLRISSYGNETISSQVLILDDISVNIMDRHVLLIDDIVDTGKTMIAAKERLENYYFPKSIRICSLLVKAHQRVQKVPVDFCGFHINSEDFVVGYGMGLGEQYRNLPYLTTKERIEERIGHGDRYVENTCG
jgi:hypoxanthine phosphoribosyltransferase